MLVAPRTDQYTSLVPAFRGLFSSIRDKARLHVLYNSDQRHTILGGKSARLLRRGDIIACCQLGEAMGEDIESALTVLSVSATRFDTEAGLVYLHARDEQGEVRSGYVRAARLVPTLSSGI